MPVKYYHGADAFRQDYPADRARALLEIGAAHRIDLPRPGGLAGLQVLAARLSLRREHREALKMPARTLADRGGDWDDVVCLLASAARHAGLATRIEVGDVSMHLQARQGEAGAWETVGPPGYVPRKRRTD